MARSLWSGSLAFGLVNIPVELVSAIVDKTIHFHQLHDADGARIEEKRVCSKDKEEVSFQHIVKGYEVKRGKFVQVSAEELDALAPEKSRSIALESFVPLAQINPAYFQHPYYLRPAEGAEKAYGLLREVLAKTDRIGIARMVMRGKEYLVAVRALEGALALSTLWFSDEVVEPKNVDGVPKAAKPAEKELSLATQIVESLAHDFDPKSYKDEYRGRVEELLAKKARGEKLVVAPEKTARPSNVVDLMAALNASLESKAKPKSSARPASAAPRRAQSRRKPPARRRRA